MRPHQMFQPTLLVLMLTLPLSAAIHPDCIQQKYQYAVQVVQPPAPRPSSVLQGTYSQSMQRQNPTIAGGVIRRWWRVGLASHAALPCRVQFSVGTPCANNVSPKPVHTLQKGVFVPDIDMITEANATDMWWAKFEVTKGMEAMQGARIWFDWGPGVTRRRQDLFDSHSVLSCIFTRQPPWPFSSGLAPVARDCHGFEAEGACNILRQ